MATQYAVFIPDYAGATSAGFTGTITAGTATAALTVGKYRLFRIFAAAAAGTAGAIPMVVRFTMGSTDGVTAPAPTSSSPFFLTGQELLFEMSGSYDQIRLNVLAADNTATSSALIYSIVPFSKS